MDAIIIADSGAETLSATNQMKLSVGDRIADIQTVRNLLQHNGSVMYPVEGDNGRVGRPLLN